jgi:tetratricopeptide (TPR) repeat protein
MSRSHLDCRDVPLSTTNAQSLARLERATTLAASYFVDPLAEIDAALAEDPDFAMGHGLKAALAVMSSEKAALPMLASSVAAIERLPHANDRERAHAAAGRAWLQGDFEGAIQRYGDILLAYPRDLIALQTAHVGDFLLGQTPLLRDRIAQVLPHWSDDVPGHGYALGMYAFGLEENNHHGRAADVGLRALALDRRDPWAVHAVTHTMEMEGRPDAGIRFLEGRSADWAPGNGFAFHNWWHLALFHLERNDTAAALALYDRAIHPQPTPIAYENVDASALLWRLWLRGTDVGPRFAALADCWAPTAADAFYAFNDVHAVMAFVGAGDLARAEATVTTMATAAGSNARMTADVGLPLARGLLSFGRGAYADAIAHIMPMRHRAHRFGGSNAQRDVIQLTLTEAARRAGQKQLHQALVAERLAQKPESPFNRLLAARTVPAASNEPEREAQVN